MHQINEYRKNPSKVLGSGTDGQYDEKLAESYRK
jgi:hypothetical protein